jgi:hypothetical protein
MVFDVGGQHGYDALVFAKLAGPEGRVVSFDCEPSAVAEMERNFAANPALANKVTPRLAFVGTGAGCLSIDEAAREYFQPTFIKLDIEGGEVDALRGASEALRQRPSLLIEVHGESAEAESRKILVEHGYQPETVNRRKWLTEYRPMAHNRWLVCRRPSTG